MHVQYRSPWGEVRIGRILEDLDSLTALIAFDHWCAGAGKGRAGQCRAGHGRVGRAALAGRLAGWQPPRPPIQAGMCMSAGGCWVAASRQLPAPNGALSHLHLAACLPACLPCPCACSDVADESSRPPLVVTAGVEAIELRGSQLNLEQDMRVGGWVGG